MDAGIFVISTALSNKCQRTRSHQTDKQRRRWQRNKRSICTVQLFCLFTLPFFCRLARSFPAQESFAKWFIRSVGNSITMITHSVSKIFHDFCANHVWDFSPASSCVTRGQSNELKPVEEIKSPTSNNTDEFMFCVSVTRRNRAVKAIPNLYLQ